VHGSSINKKKVIYDASCGNPSCNRLLKTTLNESGKVTLTLLLGEKIV